MRVSSLRLFSVSAFGLAIFTAACSGNGTPSAPEPTSTATAPGGSGGGSGSATPTTPAQGSLAINLTDSPFTDAKALLVTFSEVSVHHADVDSWEIIPFAGTASSRTCDLKKLNGPTDVLGVGSLPAGHYTQVRLVVSSAALYFDNASSGPACAPSIPAPAGTNAPVTIPSGEVKLNNEFTVASGGTTMLLDFDGDQSVRQTGGGNGRGNGGGPQYLMTPVIRIVSVQ